MSAPQSGFSIKSNAPCLMAWTAVAMSPLPDIIMTGTRKFAARNSLSTSSPDLPGRCNSITMHKGAVADRRKQREIVGDRPRNRCWTGIWSRATPKGAQVAGGYLTIENKGTTPDRLISATSAAAAKVEIHEMTTLNDIMVMRPVEGGFTVPSDSGVILAPGGSHLIFTGVTAPFSEGQRVASALTFEKAGTIDVSFDVGSVGAKGPQLIVASTDPVVAAAVSHAPS